VYLLPKEGGMGRYMNNRTKELSETLGSLLENGQTALSVFGIDGDRISQVEEEYPEVSKHGVH